MHSTRRIFLAEPCRKDWFRLPVVFVLLFVTLMSNIQTVRADEYHRIENVQRTIDAQYWQLVQWSDQEAICDIYLEHDGSPTYDEVKTYCGEPQLDEWIETPSCTPAKSGADTSGCTGLYIRYLGEVTTTIVQPVELPAASVSVQTVNCGAWQWCSSRPVLRFSGYEPLSDYEIEEVRVRIGSRERSCDGNSCELRMPVTDEAGVMVEYWAVSSYGDESNHFFLRLRNSASEETGLYRLDLLGDQWKSYAPSGAVFWRVFPSLNNPYASLMERPTSASQLATDHSLALLAGFLIRNRYVDAAGCPDGGLLDNGSANACGEEAGRQQTLQWQNRYDAQIYSAALQYDIPPRLLKGIIARETQFWPVTQNPYELGLGRLTENGADMLLTWNVDFFLNICTPVYGADACAGGYTYLASDEKLEMRGRAMGMVGTDEELKVLAATLKASMLQITQMVDNVSEVDLEYAASFEDLWELTVANYHAGSGCIGTAMQYAVDNNQPLSWDAVSQQLLGECQGAVDYVSDVFELGK